MSELQKVFTADDAWTGGYYELLIKPAVASSEALCALVDAVWSFSSVEGCYLDRNKEPCIQKRTKARDHPDADRLYGLATLPNNITVPCGSIKVDYAGETAMSRTRWVSFYLPVGAISLAYPVGAYPFGSMVGLSVWQVPVDAFLTNLANWVFENEPFDFALVGFEMTTLEDEYSHVRANGVPNERDHGILWNESGKLNWYPATRS